MLGQSAGLRCLKRATSLTCSRSLRSGVAKHYIGRHGLIIDLDAYSVVGRKSRKENLHERNQTSLRFSAGDHVSRIGNFIDRIRATKQKTADRYAVETNNGQRRRQLHSSSVQFQIRCQWRRGAETYK